MQQPDAAHVHALAAEREIVSAGVGVAVLNGVDDLGHGDAEREQLVGIDLRLILARRSAKDGDVDDARHLLHLADQEPVLRGLQLIQRVAGPGKL